MIGLAIELAYALEAKAKRDNQRANEKFSFILHFDTTFDGSCGSVAEDVAWEECKRTARLAEACADLVQELEDMNV